MIRQMSLALTVTSVCASPAFFVGALSVQLSRDLGLSFSLTAAAISTYFIASAASSMILGTVADAVGSIRGMQIAITLAAISLVGISAAVSLGILVVFLSIGGFANAAGQVSSSSYIAQAVHPSRRGLAFGVKQAGIPVATSLAGIAIPLIALPFGWRLAFVASAALASGTIVFIRRENERSGRQAPFTASSRRERLHGRSTKALALAALGAAFGAFAVNCVALFFVTSAVHAGRSPHTAGLMFAVGSLIAVITRISAGWAADKRDNRLLLVVAMMFAGSLGCLLFATGVLATGFDFLILIAVVLAFGGALGWPGLLGFVVVRQNPSRPAAATGALYTGSYAGAISGPVVFAWMSQQMGFGSAWFLTAVIAALAGFTILASRHFFMVTPPHGYVSGCRKDEDSS